LRILADGINGTEALGGALVEYRVMKYRVYLEPDEDGVFVATCPALPGCVSQGRTRVEATSNIREAIEGYLKSLRKHGDPLPSSTLLPG
jgi:predicted RNase H-like HicB family nuclease